MKKRCLSLLSAMILCICMMPTALAAGTEITVVQPSRTAEVGDTMTVTGEIKGNPGVAAVQFALTYDDSVLKCTGVSTGPVLDRALSATNPNAPDGAIVAAASASELTKDGVLATFTFRVVGEGQPDFGLADYVLSDASGEAVAFTVKGAEKETAPVEPETPQTQPEQPKPGETVPAQPETGTEHLFTDTADHPLEQLINTAVDRGYFEGYADGTFRPDGRVTRGAFVTVLWRMAGRPQPAVEVPFTDSGAVSAEFRQAIAWAYGKGYINGRTATTFAPSDPVSRQAALKIVFNYAGGVSGQEVLFTQIYDDAFTDSGTMADWAKAPLYWGIYNELIEGTTETTLGPAVPATRAELARILVGYVDRFE